VSSAVQLGTPAAGFANHGFALRQRLGLCFLLMVSALLLQIAGIVLRQLRNGRCHLRREVRCPPVEVIESPRHLARDFDVRRLVFTTGT